VAIVTGAGGLIGRAIARRLADEGGSVVCAGRTPATLERTVSEIVGAGGAAIAVETYIADTDQVQAMVAQTLEAYRAVDVLVNNAAATGGPDVNKAFEATTHDDWTHTLDVSLRGTLLCTWAVLPHMIERGSRRVVNITSAAGKSTPARVTLYATAKSGVAGFTRALARDVGRYGILVNAIAPGPIADEDVKMPGEMLERIAKTTVVRRIGLPGDVAAMVALLASDDGNFITAQQISVDGGGTSSH